MARRDDEDSNRRRRRREEEDEQERLAKQAKESTKGSITKAGIGRIGAPAEVSQVSATGIGQTSQLQSLLKQAVVEMERIHNLYVQFISGVEKIPPIQARKSFDQLISAIDKSSKMTAAMQFQAQTVINRARIYWEKWDKMMRDREGGKR